MGAQPVQSQLPIPPEGQTNNIIYPTLKTTLPSLDKYIKMLTDLGLESDNSNGLINGSKNKKFKNLSVNGYTISDLPKKIDSNNINLNKVINIILELELDIFDNYGVMKNSAFSLDPGIYLLRERNYDNLVPKFTDDNTLVKEEFLNLQEKGEIKYVLVVKQFGNVYEGNHINKMVLINLKSNTNNISLLEDIVIDNFNSIGNNSVSLNFGIPFQSDVGLVKINSNNISNILSYEKINYEDAFDESFNLNMTGNEVSISNANNPDIEIEGIIDFEGRKLKIKKDNNITITDGEFTDPDSDTIINEKVETKVYNYNKLAFGNLDSKTFNIYQSANNGLLLLLKDINSTNKFNITLLFPNENKLQ